MRALQACKQAWRGQRDAAVQAQGEGESADSNNGAMLHRQTVRGRWTRLLRRIGLRKTPVEVGAVEREYADAVKGGDADHVRLCLLAGLPPTRLDDERQHHAIRGGHRRPFDFVLVLGLPRATKAIRRGTSGAVKDAVHGRHWAPLHEAASAGRLSMCRSPLAARAGPKIALRAEPRR